LATIYILQGRKTGMMVSESGISYFSLMDGTGRKWPGNAIGWFCGSHFKKWKTLREVL